VQTENTEVTAEEAVGEEPVEGGRRPMVVGVVGKRGRVFEEKGNKFFCLVEKKKKKRIEKLKKLFRFSLLLLVLQ